MKKIITLIFTASCLLTACNNASPEKTFSIASLNCNSLYGFASTYELNRDLATPQEKLMDEKTMKMALVTRAEMVKDKLARVEENYEKVKSLGSSDDSKEMINASLALYEFVIPVYKKEYAELAALYDGNAAPDKIEAASKNITDKYAVEFEERYNNVVKTGKAYAEKHGIDVRQVNPSPR
jgi:hypothetical protein